MDLILTQITSKKGIKKHVERAVSALYKEYTPLEYMKVMVALYPGRLTILKNKGALRAINLIKENEAEK